MAFIVKGRVKGRFSKYYYDETEIGEDFEMARKTDPLSYLFEDSFVEEEDLSKEPWPDSEY